MTFFARIRKQVDSLQLDVLVTGGAVPRPYGVYTGFQIGDGRRGGKLRSSEHGLQLRVPLFAGARYCKCLKEVCESVICRSFVWIWL